MMAVVVACLVAGDRAEEGVLAEDVAEEVVAVVVACVVAGDRAEEGVLAEEVDMRLWRKEDGVLAEEGVLGEEVDLRQHFGRKGAG